MESPRSTDDINTCLLRTDSGEQKFHVATDDHEGHKHPHPQHEDQQGYKLSQPNAEFAFALYKNLSALPEFQSKNIIFSPLSISMALSMLALGAKGDTFSQLYQALGYAEMTPETVNEAYKHIFHLFDHKQENLHVDMGSAVVITERARIMKTFLEDAKHYYESEMLSVDFSKPDATVQKINKYIARQTNNTISDMVQKVNPATVMMLINCIYFRGEWITHFKENLTKKDYFHVDRNTKVAIDMMEREGWYKVCEDKENFVTVITLPYRCSTSMIIVLPHEGKMKNVEESISQAHIKHWDASQRGSIVTLHVPKFSLSGQYSLKETLKEMGMVSVFSETADFSGMTDEKVTMSQVEHKTFLSIDEKGTEVAAATALHLCGCGPSEPETIKINRPFLVFITESTTKSILFMGKISNPTSN